MLLPTAPPTLIFHGANDNVVDVSQSELLANKLANEGVKHQLVIYPREGHGWYGAALTKSFDQIELFLKSNVK
jgi:dipeptidyl aminopeptidase/acylaminoacyl peptidase